MIYVFGDSYADKQYNKNELTDPWYSLFEEDITNFALQGTSQDYSFNLLYNNIPSIYRIPNKIIFILSVQERCDFYGVPAEDSCNFIYDKNALKTNITNSNFIRKYYIKYKKYIEFYFKSRQEELQTKTLRHILSLYSLSMLYNVPTIVLCVQRPNIVKQGYINISSPIFAIYPYDLKEISTNEFIDKKIFSDAVDTRRNHLSNQNHMILYNNINSFFESNNINYYTHAKDFLNDKNNTNFIYL